MKASECTITYPTDEASERVDHLADYINEHPKCLNDLDRHWGEVMKLAERYGFIAQAYGGTAMLSTHSAMLDAFGTKEVAKIMRMNNIELPDSWEVEE